MVLRFLVDEDLPRSTVKVLRAAGYVAVDVRDIGLRGAKDSEILAYALHNQMTIVTADVGFGNLVYQRGGEQPGMVVLRLPTTIPTQELNQVLLRALAALEAEEVKGGIVVVDKRKVRVRRRRNG